tara:strand:+ start:136 stop:339 length:204 start_codon:yes stop_codon:yes gene_type:complete
MIKVMREYMPVSPKELRVFIITKGFNQETLAKYLGVSKTTVARWCNGKNPMPPYMRLTLIGIVKFNQ